MFFSEIWKIVIKIVRKMAKSFMEGLGAIAIGGLINYLRRDNSAKRPSQIIAGEESAAVLKREDNNQAADLRVTDSGNLELILTREGKNDFNVNTSIIDRDYFIKDWYSPVELELIARFERSTQKIMSLASPRKYSGMYPYSHIDNVVENVFNFASQKNPITFEKSTRIDLSTVIVAIGHDRIEDDPRHKDMLAEWYGAVKEGNNKRRKELSLSLYNLRKQLCDEIKEELFGYLEDIRKKNGKIPNHNYIKRQIREAAELIYGLTRFSDEHPYSISMGEVYKRKKGESPRTAFKRGLLKNCDRIANGTETEPQEAEVIEWLDSKFKSDQAIEINGEVYKLGEFLTGRLGKVSTKAEAMPESVRLQVAANSIFPLHFSAETINDYNRNRSRGRNYARGSDSYMGLAILSRARLLDVTISLLDSAIEAYEKDPDIIKEKDRIDKSIQNKKSGDYFKRITVPGSISKLIVYDVGGQKVIREFDKLPENRVHHYEIAREVRESLPNFRLFYDPTETKDGKSQYIGDLAKYDPRKHRFWTLPGVDQLTGLMQDPFTQYASLMSGLQEKRKGGKGRGSLALMI